MRQQIKLVVMDPDYGYLKTLEKQIILQFADRAEIQFITDPAYREQYFSTMRNLDLLVTGQEFYGEYLKNHNIAHTLVLKKEEEGSLMEMEKPVDLPEDFEVTVNLDELMAEDHASGEKPIIPIQEDEAPSGFFLEESIIAQLDAVTNGESGENPISDINGSADLQQGSAAVPVVDTELELSDYNEECIVMSKFCTIREIMDVMEDLLSVDVEPEIVQEPLNKKPLKVISVYSPIGGCGKSLVTLGLGRKLRKLDQSVLLIGCDEMQSISGFLESEESADPLLAEMMRQPGVDIYWNILQNVEYEGEVRYLLPFEKPLSAMGIGTNEMENLVKIIKGKQDFDFVILDLGSALNTTACKLMQLSDCIVLLTEPNAVSVKKMKKIVNNAALLPDCKCFMLANQHHMDGLRLPTQNLFGYLASYQDPEAALEDPVFYQIALEVLD
ncbi:MAG: AAA family ATPase [Lachnospiraceae bacterium]|nr:AAA family ATPase [Lachnospiraceae bacterium]